MLIYLIIILSMFLLVLPTLLRPRNPKEYMHKFNEKGKFLCYILWTCGLSGFAVAGILIKHPDYEYIDSSFRLGIKMLGTISSIGAIIMGFMIVRILMDPVSSICRSREESLFEKRVFDENEVDIYEELEQR